VNSQPPSRRQRSLDLRTRLAINFTLFSSLVVGLALGFTYLSYRARSRAEIRQRLLDIVSVAALQQDGDAFAAIRSPDDPQYQEILLKNLEIRKTDPEIAYVYTMGVDDIGIYFVTNSTEPGTTGPTTYGERYVNPSPALAANYSTISRPIVESGPYAGEFGTYFSAYAPFYTRSGQLAGILGVDIRASDVFERDRQTLTQLLTLFIFLLPIVGIAGWLYGDSLAAPIRSLTNATARIEAGEISHRPAIRGATTEVLNLRSSIFSMADQLKSLIDNLEQRVAERTQDLETHSADLQTVARIARDISQSQNVDDLLDQTARLIRERFSIYHVGIFLVDESEEFAVLRAAGGEAGQLLLANKHRLRIGEVGIVGHVTRSGEPRIALDVGTDAVHFRNPLLPYTRSEMTLPLKIENRIIGALDVQSDKVNAFDQDDVSIMQILTDQLSIAIERTRLLQELARNAAVVEQSSQEFTARTWRTFLQQARKELGYRYEGVSIEPLTAPSRETLEALETGQSVVFRSEEGKPESILAVPIRLRGQTLGTLNLHFQNPEIPQETMRLVEEAADRLALALENARLVQDAQRLATRERQINQISAQVQQSTDLETVLQNTVRELGNTLGAPRTFIQIGLTASNDKDK
jgi:GAF domain-containing protein/HAMP domain-containing protein